MAITVRKRRSSIMETLSGIYHEARTRKGNEMSNEEIRGINLRLMLLVQLSSLQINIAQEIEQCLRKHGAYNFSIKHNHKKLVDFVRNSGNKKFWETLNQEQIDAICDDADTLEDIIYRFAGLKE